MLNQLQIIGNVGKAPEIRATQNGARVASFSVAVNEKWKDKSGQRKEKTEWIPVVVWSEGLVGVIEKYVTKGMRVYVQGKMQTRKWTDKDGADRYTTECVLQGFDGKLVMLSDAGGSGTEKPKHAPAQADSFDDGDDIPFYVVANDLPHNQ